MDTHSLINFLRHLEVVKHDHPFILDRKLVDLGLIITKAAENEDEANRLEVLLTNAIFEHTRKHPLIVKVNGGQYPEPLAKSLVQAFQKGCWVVVIMEADPSPEVLRILKELSENNEFTYIDRSINEMRLIPQSSDSRIIVCIDEVLLSSSITYPNFMTLFGLILRR